MKLFILLMMIFFSIFMFYLKHPLAMGLFILSQTILVSIFIGLFMSTYWFSYILFMVFMGGMLVLFIYVASIASNELMKISFMWKMIMLSSLISFFLSLIFFKNINLLNLFYNNEYSNIMSMIWFYNENNFNLSKLYNKQTYILTMMIIIYLFITLIAVIKITNIFFGPLRSFN